MLHPKRSGFKWFQPVLFSSDASLTVTARTLWTQNAKVQFMMRVSRPVGASEGLYPCLQIQPQDWYKAVHPVSRLNFSPSLVVKWGSPLRRERWEHILNETQPDRDILIFYKLASFKGASISAKGQNFRIRLYGIFICLVKDSFWVLFRA